MTDAKSQMIEDYSEDDDDSAEREEAYREWQQARTPRQGPFPQLLICEKGKACDEEHETRVRGPCVRM